MSLRFGIEDLHERRPVLALLAMAVTTFTGAQQLPSHPVQTMSPPGMDLVLSDAPPSLPVLADAGAFEPCSG